MTIDPWHWLPLCLLIAQPRSDVAGTALTQPAQLEPVVVTSTRLNTVSAFETPASISVVELDGQRNRPLVNLSDVLGAIPGVLARDRQNFAQDTQLAIRGFGARATFGVRGLRLYADGIPATLPDGQGQISHFNLLGGERVEVMRGPFSALYGNSAGGVIRIESAGGSDDIEASLVSSVGGHDSYTLGTRLRGSNASGMVGYSLAVTAFDTGGYRDHSAARRESANLKLQMGRGNDHQLDLIVNHFNAPAAQDPLGLTREQVRVDPRQAPLAEQFNTRKSASQHQAGMVWTQELAAGHSMRVLGYGGQRKVEQFLALPQSAQANSLNSGGVVDLDARYRGGDLRWSWSGELAGRALEWSAGSTADSLHQDRRGYENFVGTTLGTRGALRRDERGRVGSNDQYVQAWWQLSDRTAILAGARHSRVQFHSIDHYITTSNPDDSGRTGYSDTTPVLGLTYCIDTDWTVYGSAGRGFETPTFNELAYRADGAAGLALDLRAATSTNIELGSKWRAEGGPSIEAALFRAETDDEIAVARNVGGRSSFRNAGRARRQGFEVASTLRLPGAWTAEVAYTRLDARFRDDFSVCSSAGCSSPTTQVNAGTRIPGVPRETLFARLQWRQSDWTAAFELTGVGAVTVNDSAADRSPGYGLVHVELARHFVTEAGGIRAFVRIDNVLDQRYIGSVIVNEANNRFFEPGADRTLLLGVQWQWPQ